MNNDLMLIIKLIELILFLLRFQFCLKDRANIRHSFELPSDNSTNISRLFQKEINRFCS